MADGASERGGGIYNGVGPRRESDRQSGRSHDSAGDHREAEAGNNAAGAAGVRRRAVMRTIAKPLRVSCSVVAVSVAILIGLRQVQTVFAQTGAGRLTIQLTNVIDEP